MAIAELRVGFGAELLAPNRRFMLAGCCSLESEETQRIKCFSDGSPSYLDDCGVALEAEVSSTVGMRRDVLGLSRGRVECAVSVLRQSYFQFPCAVSMAGKKSS